MSTCGSIPRSDRARARQVHGWLRSDLMPLRDERPTTTMFYARATAPLSERAQAAADKLLRAAEQLVPNGEGPLFGEFCVADADLAFMLHRLILNADEVPERIVRAMSQPVIDHRGPKFNALVQECLAGLREIFKAPNGHIVLYPGSGTGAGEARLDGTGRVAFPVVEELQPGQTLTLTVEVEAAQIGDARFKAEVKATHLRAPLKEEQETRVTGK